MIYKPRKGSPLTQEQAQRYGPRIQELIDRYGDVSAEDVLKDAKKKSSPLHDFFEWDDAKASRLYRLEQARMMVRSVEIVVIDSRGKEVRPRAFLQVPVRDARSGLDTRKHTIIPVQHSFVDGDLRDRIILGFRRRINALRREMRQMEGLDEAARLLGEADDELGSIA
jgi:hypothetical protein